MKIEEIAKHAEKPRSTECEVLFLNGVVEQDYEDQLFRLYGEPLNHRSFFLIKKEDVCGEIYEWTQQECLMNGVIGAKMFRVPLRAGTEVMFVNISLQKIGETISGASMRVLSETVGCQDTTGCIRYDKYCCTRSAAGQPCYCDNCCLA
ncbi:MAG: hypothetical protein AABZ14_07180 [Candidatus Margulisiibacteriota bacterium]